MRKPLLAGCVILLLVGGSLFASAQSFGAAAQAKVAAILARFPNGGTGLRDAIAAAVETAPSLAQAVVAAAQTATPAQQEAIGGGLAAAATFFANEAAGSGAAADAARNAEQQILAAMASAPTIAQTAFATAGGPAALAIALGGSATNMGTDCVSPSHGHERCNQH
jgi:hypothetical protein